MKVGSYASSNSLPPSALVSQKMQEKDPMAYAKYGERVKYLVINGINKIIFLFLLKFILGNEKSRLKDLVVSVEEFMENHNYSLNCDYYINNQINAALYRLFSTFDIDIHVKIILIIKL